jgi:hypothetical protein
MAFLRFSRDKRGYEYFSLVQPTNRRGKSVSRILYAFRSPPNVKVGREPFDDAARHALEAQHPDVTFDWAKLSAAPLPAVEPERWRERRNAERAAKLAAHAEASVEPADVEPEEAAFASVPPPPEPVAEEAAPGAILIPTESAEATPQSARRRRRRRRGRRGRATGEGEPQTAASEALIEPHSGESLEAAEPSAPLESDESVEPPATPDRDV